MVNEDLRNSLASSLAKSCGISTTFYSCRQHKHLLIASEQPQVLSFDPQVSNLEQLKMYTRRYKTRHAKCASHDKHPISNLPYAYTCVPMKNACYDTLAWESETKCFRARMRKINSGHRKSPLKGVVVIRLRDLSMYRLLSASVVQRWLIKTVVPWNVPN